MKKKAYSSSRSILALTAAFVVFGITIVTSTMAGMGGSQRRSHEGAGQAGDILLTSGIRSTETLATEFNPGEVLTEVGQNVLADSLETLFSKFPRRILPAERERLAKMLVEEGQRAGIDPLFLAAVIRVESAFYSGAISNKGAMGLMQVMPETGPEQLHDLETNVRLGVYYLDQLLEMYKGNYKFALTAYNRGPTNVRFIVRRHGKLEARFTEYYRKIRQTYRAYLRSIDGLSSAFLKLS